jgi:membrane protease YdiL (CAAX protease family)
VAGEYLAETRRVRIVAVRSIRPTLASMFAGLWNRLPAIVRGILVAELVVSIGGIPPSIAVVLNLRTSPSIPWMLVVTAGWLWFFWWYLSGHGWPRNTQDARRRDLRAPSLSKPAWTWALIAGALGITGTIALAFVTARLAHLPREAFAAPVDFSKYPMLIVVCAIACISATAGVVEETGFRGFLISPIERRHGWTIAILISGIVFFLDHHLSHAYATWVFLPFFMAISAVHGLLVKYSGSIRPSIVLHAVADFIVIPITYGLVGSFSVESLSVTGIDRHFIIWVAVMVMCLGALVPALRVLGARSETTRGK